MEKRELKQPAGLEALQAWKLCGPGGSAGLEALRACHYHPPSQLLSFQVDQKVVTTLFPNFRFLAYDTFFLKIHTGQTNHPIQFFFRPKCVEMSKLP